MAGSDFSPPERMCRRTVWPGLVAAGLTAGVAAAAAAAVVGAGWAALAGAAGGAVVGAAAAGAHRVERALDQTRPRLDLPPGRLGGLLDQLRRGPERRQDRGEDADPGPGLDRALGHRLVDPPDLRPVGCRANRRAGQHDRV